MEPKNKAVAARFAESLVGTMLQRSGAEFDQTKLSRHNTADFIVRNDDSLILIEVKYTADPNNVSAVWKAWSDGIDNEMSASSPKQELREKTDEPQSAHLVVVTGTGEKVFTDDVTAQLLGPDHRTVLKILDPVVSGSKRKMTN